MVWGGILGDDIIGPFFFEGNVNGLAYLEMLQQNVVPALNQLELPIGEIMFQQDRAPAHYETNVRDWLTATFETWIGRGGRIHWPARSPDFNPLDFFVWGYVKHRVYLTQPTNMDNLRAKIIEAFQSITPEMLAATRNNFVKRMDLAIQENGGLIEHLL